MVLGMGFTFDDFGAEKGVCSPISTMSALIEERPNSNDYIFPYIGGEEINDNPTHLHRRYIIDFGESSYEYLEKECPELMKIVEKFVRPERNKLKDNIDGKKYKREWWKFGRRGVKLYNKINSMRNVLAVSRVSSNFSVAAMQSNFVFADSCIVFAFDKKCQLAALQARPHEVWARFFASSMKDDLRYTPSDCFETFPFPPDFETSEALEAAGQTYHDFRAALMIENDQGMTKTYNRFHDPLDTTPGIVRLRELHAEMDRAVLTAYGWDDLAARANPVFLEKPADENGRGYQPGEPEDDHTYQGRLFWPSDFRDEVLARLLALNAERAEEEREAGLTPQPSTDDEEESEDA